MNIINVEVVNTGGGCLITTIEVSPTATNIEGLKIIGINEEGIVGYSSAEVTGNLDDVLFVAETFKQAAVLIGEKLAAKCEQAYYSKGGQNL